MKKRLLIYHPKLDGYALEYIGHLLLYKSQDVDLFLVLPAGLKNRGADYSWIGLASYEYFPIPSNIQESIDKRGLLRSSFAISRYVSKIVKMHRINQVLALMFTAHVLYLSLLVKNVSCIVHYIYIHSWKNLSIMGKINNVAKFYFLAKNPKVSNVFLLNDETERYFNNLYKTNKFKYLPDPFMKIEHIPMDLRTKLSIPSDAEIFLHFGGLSERKGTIELLEAISLLTKEEAANKFFIFAGKISSSIKSRFYDIYDKVKDNHHIILLDEFCSFELLHDLCYTSNYIVTPNKLSAISSGVLGYAAYFGKPVIGPNTGIMGRLIRKYRLGIPLISISPQLIKDAICEICSYPYKESSYRNIVDLQNFTKVIYSNLIGI